MLILPKTKSRANTAPWIVEIFNGRTPRQEEVVWMLKALLEAQEIQNESQLADFQHDLSGVLGTLMN